MRRITFNTAVEKVEPVGDHWEVTTSDGTTREYKNVLVANGHHSSPKIPQFEGEFTGESFHAHDYRDLSVFRGKRVLVIGVGEPGMDIALTPPATPRPSTCPPATACT